MPEAKKKSNVALWLGLGCGGFLLLGVIGSVVAYLLVGSVATGVSVTGGSAVCAKAAECCVAMVTKTGGDKAAIDACANMKALPEIGCVQALEHYKKAAPVAGFKCE